MDSSTPTIIRCDRGAMLPRLQEADEVEYGAGRQSCVFYYENNSEASGATVIKLQFLSPHPRTGEFSPVQLFQSQGGEESNEDFPDRVEAWISGTTRPKYTARNIGMGSWESEQERLQRASLFQFTPQVLGSFLVAGDENAMVLGCTEQLRATRVWADVDDPTTLADHSLPELFLLLERVAKTKLLMDDLNPGNIVEFEGRVMLIDWAPPRTQIPSVFPGSVTVHEVSGSGNNCLGVSEQAIRVLPTGWRMVVMYHALWVGVHEWSDELGAICQEKMSAVTNKVILQTTKLLYPTHPNRGNILEWLRGMLHSTQ